MKHILSLLTGLFVCVLCSAQVQTYTLKVIKEYPHDPHAYTQGLFFNDGKLYESTGLCGQSSLREVNLENGEVLVHFDLSKKYFGEGSVILNNKVYMLTWKNHVLMIFDAQTLDRTGAYSYPVEGWGLTTDGKQLIASDGSDKLYFLSEDLKLGKIVNVTMNGKKITRLNELEWIDGKIWANVYTTDFIVIINPDSGKVESLIDCSGLLPDKLRTRDTDVLNGIASNDGKIYLTGKNWPRLYQVELCYQ